MRKDKRNHNIIVFVLSVFSIILFVILVKDSNERNSISTHLRESVKGKFVLVETNEIGCKHYLFNGDHVWKCPRDTGISEIGRKVCRHSKHGNMCYYVYDPVLSEVK